MSTYCVLGSWHRFTPLNLFHSPGGVVLLVSHVTDGAQGPGSVISGRPLGVVDNPLWRQDLGNEGRWIRSSHSKGPR